MSIVLPAGNSALTNQDYENKARNTGYRMIAGVDEAGRGPLAGPVVAAAVILPKNTDDLHEVNDSKKISPQKRQELYMLIHEKADAIGVGVVDARTIDQINILEATFLAMQKAVKTLSKKPDYILIDGNRKPLWLTKGETIINGDAISVSIAAASIIAKVTRDKIMDDYEHHFPNWGFAKHKGYGTVAHISAIKEHGICDIHRKSFAPISKFLRKK